MRRALPNTKHRFIMDNGDEIARLAQGEDRNAVVIWLANGDLYQLPMVASEDAAVVLFWQVIRDWP